MWQLSLLALALALPACLLPPSSGGAGGGDVGSDGGGGTAACGPARATVADVIDGDTIVLSTGEHVRYLLIDAPETTYGHDDCYGRNASAFDAALVAGQTVDLTYDVDCADDYGRLLAYVSIAEVEVNALMIERGYACVLHIPPNGDDRVAAYADLQARARADGRGLWSACDPLPPACR